MVERRAYFIGATIATRQALERVDRYEMRLLGEVNRSEEKHLTILPPFLATYEEASEINMGCAMSSILSTHPMNTTMFAMQGLDIMEFGGVQFLHFPIQTFTTGESWADFVLRIRKRLHELKLEFRHPIPKEYRPHITLMEGEHLRGDRSVQALIRESIKESKLHFHATYLTLYAKYKRGWDTVSSDPERG